MEPIISPWIIYWIGVISEARGLLMILSAFSGLASATAAAVCLTDEFPEGSDARKTAIWWRKTAFITFVVLASCTILLPTKQTMVAMVVANNVTPDNLSKAAQVGSDWEEALKADVIEIIESGQDNVIERSD